MPPKMESKNSEPKKKLTRAGKAAKKQEDEKRSSRKAKLSFRSPWGECNNPWCEPLIYREDYTEIELNDRKSKGPPSTCKACKLLKSHPSKRS